MIVDVQNAQESMGKVMAHLAELGFRVERIPIAKFLPELRSYDRLTPEQVAAYKAIMEKLCYWKLTLADAGVKAEWTEDARDVRIDARLENGVLKLALDGRVDSLYAPKLLALYERAKKENRIDEIRVDCGKLSYISSAGLRVLLIMTKAHPGHVLLSHVGEAVMDVFEVTGFADFLNIEK